MQTRSSSTGSHPSSSRGPVPPRAGSSYSKSPFLYPQPEDRLQEEVATDLELFSLDGRLVAEPEENEHDDGTETEGEDEHDPEESVHVPGVPRSKIRLEARRYTTSAFSANLIVMLRDELRTPGWADLPQDVEGSALSIHKVSGSLTNAVFFVSCPIKIHDDYSPPTVLLRIYGPSSGSLISRQSELRILHTLSAVYGIGPAVFGTFSNGRVEQYFRSRALDRNEMRDPRTSRWIARRMRELHHVNMDVMRAPPKSPALHPKSPGLYPASSDMKVKSTSSSSDSTMPSLPSSAAVSVPVSASSSYQRPPLYTHRNSSTTSILSNASDSSLFSLASTYSSSSAHSLTSAAYSTKSGVSESHSANKKRSRSTMRLPRLKSHSSSKDSLAAWTNISSWTKQARKVLVAIEKLEDLPGLKVMPKGDRTGCNPLLSPSLLLEFAKKLDLKQFEIQVNEYRNFVRQWEGKNGKSKRVFAHNDTQYGNLLRLTPGGTEDMVEGLRAPHEMIIVVDFEYAGINSRGFDIANHFLEWQTDYHHPSDSYNLHHGAAPTLQERRRFYRAYFGADGGYDGDDDPSGTPLPEDAEDPRVLRLDEEVKIWHAASHAMYCVWGIVQARDEILARINAWTNSYGAASKAEDQAVAYLKAQHERPPLTKGKSGENVAEMAGVSDAIADFDYLSYALERVDLFRKDIEELKVGME